MKLAIAFHIYVRIYTYVYMYVYRYTMPVSKDAVSLMC